jgi:hypothetical protein
MRLGISFTRVQKSYFSNLQIKSYGCLKFLGEVWAARADQKTFYFLTLLGWIYFLKILNKVLKHIINLKKF